MATSRKTTPDKKTKQDADNITSTAVTKRRRNNSPTDPDNILHVEPGDNARYIRYAMASWNLPPIDISDPVQVSDRIEQYFQFCADNDRKPQIVGMANWLGVSRDTLNSWKRGEYRTNTHSDVIQKAVAMLEEMWAEYMLNGKVNPASGIFISKNWFGYRDEQQIVVTPNNPLDVENPEDLRKYARSLPEITSDDVESQDK